MRLRHNGIFIHEGPNLVVSDGKDLIATIVGSTATKPSHFAVGSSNVVPDESQTDLLGTEHGRQSFTTSVVDNSVNYAATFTAGGSITVGEIGIFNSATTGTMLARFTPSEFEMVLNDDLDIDWTLFFGN